MAKNEGYLFDPQLRDTFISVIAEGVLVRRYSPDGSLNQIKLWMSDESTLTWLVEGDFSSEESVSLSDIVKVPHPPPTYGFVITKVTAPVPRS